MHTKQKARKYGGRLLALGLMFTAQTVYAAPDVSYDNARIIGQSSGLASANSVARDSNGRILMLGTAQGVLDFDPSSGTDVKPNIGRDSLFLSTINADGSYGGTKLIATNTPFTPSDIKAVNVQVDANDNVYVLGMISTLDNWVNSAVVDFNPDDSQSDNQVMNSTRVMFLTKLTASGDYVWTQTIEHGLPPSPQESNVPNSDFFAKIIVSDHSLAVRPNGTAYIVGRYKNTVDFNPGSATDSQTSSGYDMFLTRINTDGSYGGTQTIEGISSFNNPVISTSGQSLYLSGVASGSVDFNPSSGTDQRNLDGLSVFVTKLNASDDYVWTRTINPVCRANFYCSEHINVFGIAATSTDDVYLTGTYDGKYDFNPSDGADEIHASPFSNWNDIFLVKLQSDGEYDWSYGYGGAGFYDEGRALAVDFQGNVFVSGRFSSNRSGRATDFNPTSGTDMQSNNGRFDFFVSVFDADGSYGTTKTVGGSSDDEANDLVVSNETLFVTGEFRGNVDFNPDAGTDNKSASQNSAFLSEYDLQY